MAIRLEDVRNLGEPLLQYNYEVTIPRVPGAGEPNIVGGTPEGFLRFKCVSASIPGYGSRSVEEDLPGGAKRKFAGMINYSRSIRLTFNESSGAPVQKALLNWHNLQWNDLTGSQAPAGVAGGGFGVGYKTQMYVDVLGPARLRVLRYELQGVFLESVGDISVGAGSNGIIQVNATFSYDWFTTDDTLGLPGLPF